MSPAAAQLIAALSVAAALFTGPASAATWVVTSSGDHDDGACDADCTLREALGRAGNGDRVGFELGPAPTITLTATLVAEASDLVIDGFDCTGCGATANSTDVLEGLDLRVGPVLDASGVVGAAAPALRIQGAGSRVEGLGIVRAPGNGLVIEADDVTVTGCLLGIDRTGTVAQGNGGYGLFAAGAGGLTLGPAVVVSGNSLGGVAVSGPGDNLRVEGNLIGTNRDGDGAVGNSGPGLTLLGLAGCLDGALIGGDGAARTNVIAGNGSDGIGLRGCLNGLDIEGNRIGLGVGHEAVVNAGWGLRVQAVGAAPELTVFFARLRGNAIGSNALGGIQAAAGNDWDLLGNGIGTDLAGTLERGNGGPGIHLTGAAEVPPFGWEVGGASPGSPNTIRHNGGPGVRLEGNSDHSANFGHSLGWNRFGANDGAVRVENPDGATPPPLACPDTESAYASFGIGAPTLLDAVQIGAALEVTGSVCPGAEVLVVQAGADGEPLAPLGSLIADSLGSWRLSIDTEPLSPGTWVSAFALDANGSTSMEAGAVELRVCDFDGDGVYSPSCAGDDCQDDDADTYPGAPELCDGRDDDCDGLVPPEEVDADGDGFAPCDGDCDEGDAGRFPTAEELCDDVDQDCDGDRVEDFGDTDGDGLPDCVDDTDDDRDGDGIPDVEDCGPGDPDTFPGATERCDDGVDQDCDGSDGGEGDPECWSVGCFGGCAQGGGAPPALALLSLLLGRRRRDPRRAPTGDR